MKRRARGRSGGRGAALRSVASVLAVVGLAVAIALAASEDPPVCTKQGEREPGRKTFALPPCLVIDLRAQYLATFETTKGDIEIFLDPRLGQKLVNNFVFLIRKGFYDGTIIHRVEATDDHAIVQAGARTEDGPLSLGYTIDAEAPSPVTRYLRGAVASLNPEDVTRTGSEFFIVAKDYDRIATPYKTPAYPVFGLVDGDESLATVDAIVAAPRDGVRPQPPIRIIRATVKLLPKE